MGPAAVAIACLLASLIGQGHEVLVVNWSFVCHAVVMAVACVGIMSEDIMICIAEGTSREDRNEIDEWHRFYRVTTVLCFVAGLAFAMVGRALKGSSLFVPIAGETLVNNPHVGAWICRMRQYSRTNAVGSWQHVLAQLFEMV